MVSVGYEGEQKRTLILFLLFIFILHSMLFFILKVQKCCQTRIFIYLNFFNMIAKEA